MRTKTGVPAMTTEKTQAAHDCCCTCDDCKCKRDTIGNHRDPAVALPPTAEDQPIHGPDIGHRPAGQTIHD